MASTAKAVATQKPTPEGFTHVTEGKATILFPSNNEVFYNPVQVFNRDLSTCVIQQFVNMSREEQRARIAKKRARHVQAQAGGEAAPSADASSAAAQHDDDPDHYGHLRVKVDVLEALAASGLRSIRYFKEIEGIDTILCNDFSPDAVENIKRNVVHNELNPDTQVIPNHGDANMVMHGHRAEQKFFEVIDLDPYGSATPFLDAALQSIADGGLLAVTCTDMAVLAGNHPETCYAKYGGVPLKAKYCHEMGVRLVLGCIASHASKYQRWIEPLMSCSIDFYCRMFVRVRSSAKQAKLAASKSSLVFQCTGCDSFHLQPMGRIAEGPKGNIKYKLATGPSVGSTCSDCGRPFQIGGPIWNGPLHDPEFLGKCLQDIDGPSRGKFATESRMRGMLSVCQEELTEPLYYSVHGLASRVHCNNPSHAVVRSALLNAGYKVSSSHCNPQAIKTDAPPTFMWDIIRAWEKNNPVNPRVKEANSPGAAILKAPMQTEPDLTIRADAQPSSQAQKLARFPPNPEPNWGPKAKARKREAVAPGSADEETKKAKTDEE